MSELDQPLIFISYASPDKPRVLPYFDALEKEGLNVWMDCHKLKAGQNWDFEIKRALEKSCLVVAFLSENSIKRRGYVQRELKIALDQISEKLYDDIYIVPVVLDDSIEIPAELKSLHMVFARDSDCTSQIINSLTFQLNRLGIEMQKAQRREEVYWTLTTRRESWDGLPGYEVEFQDIELKSERYTGMPDISVLIKAWLVGALLSNREVKFEQLPEIFNYGQDRFLRTNTFDAHTSGPSIKGGVMSIVYTLYHYGAGAAHPNTYYHTYSFTLDPLLQIKGLENIFVDEKASLKVLQQYVRDQLKSLKYEGAEYGELRLDADWIDQGTESWSNFSSFAFKEAGIDILFAPYHVSAYVFGGHVINVPYSAITHLLKTHYRSALRLSEGIPG